VAYNFQTVKNKIKLLTGDRSVTQKGLFDNAVLAALMSGRKYDLIPHSGNCSRETMYVPWFFEIKSVIKRHRRYRTQYGKDPLSDNVIRRWLKQYQETGSVLRRKGTGRLKTSQEGVDRIQRAWTSFVPRKARMLKLFSNLQY
jgi:hypothetical protein